jgi:hypothetical protein
VRLEQSVVQGGAAHLWALAVPAGLGGWR